MKESEVLSIRLDPPLLKEVEQIQRQLQIQMGMPVSRNRVISKLITDGAKLYKSEKEKSHA